MRALLFGRYLFLLLAALGEFDGFADHLEVSVVVDHQLQIAMEVPRIAIVIVHSPIGIATEWIGSATWLVVIEVVGPSHIDAFTVGNRVDTRRECASHTSPILDAS
jgi:hypothetical protein